MADISQIKLPNGDTFDIVDNKSGFLEKNHSIDIHNGSINWETNSFQTQHGLTISSTSMWDEDEIGGQATLTVASMADSATITLDAQNYILSLSSSSFSLHNNNATNYIKVSNNGGGLELHELISPTNDSDAATKKYVDDAIGGINVGVTKISTTAGAHTAITNATGAVSFNVPTKTSHLTNDSGFITASSIPAEFFIAEFGVTTYAEIVSAINAGKCVICRKAASVADTYDYFELVQAVMSTQVSEVNRYIRFMRATRTDTNVVNGVISVTHCKCTFYNEWTIDSLTVNDGAEKNVQSDWSQTNTTADDFIKNKPTIPTVPTNVSAFTNDSGYLTLATLPTYNGGVL